MSSRSAISALDRMRIALDLAEAATKIQRQNLRRRFPKATEEEVEECLIAWLRHRPGAEHGDADGRPGKRFSEDK